MSRARQGFDAHWVLDSIPDGVAVIEDVGTVAYLNPAAASMTGWPAAEAQGRPWAEVLHLVGPGGEDLAARLPIGRAEPLSRGTPEVNVFLRQRDGKELPVTIRCAYDRDDVFVVRRIVCMLRDGRRSRGVDVQSAELISTVSHEIRSPLTSVKGFTKTLLDRWDRFDDDMKKEMLQAVNSDADRVTRLLGELLDISRMEAGRLRLRPERVDIHELAYKVAGKLNERSERHTLEVRFPKSIPKVFADPDKVEQVLTNLVENAQKYTAGGTVTIAGRRAGGTVVVRVQDQGEGIPASQIPRLFRKFARRERAGSPTGTGLGLFICKGLIEAHGGTLAATSRMGEGSVFAFSLPISGPAT